MKIFSISIRKFGVVSAALWASLLIYLPPFQSVPSTFGQELTMGFVKAYGLLFLGVLSGVFMFYRYHFGRIIALILAVIVLYSKVASMFPNVSQRAYALYVLMLQQKPIMVIHNDVILPLFMVFTILYLMRKKIETSPGR
jgi:hypothetical protein